MLVAGCLLPGADGKVSVIWPLLCFTGMGFGFIYYWPVLLALISRSGAGQGQFDADGRGIPVAVRRQCADGLGRQLL